MSRARSRSPLRKIIPTKCSGTPFTGIRIADFFFFRQLRRWQHHSYTAVIDAAVNVASKIGLGHVSTRSGGALRSPPACTLHAQPDPFQRRPTSFLLAPDLKSGPCPPAGS